MLKFKCSIDVSPSKEFKCFTIFGSLSEFEEEGTSHISFIYKTVEDIVNFLPYALKELMYHLSRLNNVKCHCVGEDD